MTDHAHSLPPALPAPPAGRVRLIGIHGARGTGKTCYLACLYGGARGTASAAVTFDDDPSIDFLKRQWQTLRGGDTPEATAVTTPTELAMHLNADGRSWGVATRDYAGALVQRTDTGVPALKGEVKGWLAGCHAVLFFLNTDATADDLRERQDEIDLLLTELRRLSADGNRIARPLAVLLTKWDRAGTPGHDLARERERAWQHLESRPELGQIVHSLRQCSELVDLFPVSAFGVNRDGTRPPADGPHPVGLLDPLVWAALRSDEVLFERAGRKASEFGEKRHYGKCVREFRDLLERDGVNKGPVAEKARQELHRWTVRRNRLRAVVVVAAAAVLGAVLGGWWYDRASREGEAFAALEAFRQEHAGEHEAGERARRAAEFCERWPASGRAAAARGWEREDRARADALPADRAFAALQAFREQRPEDALAGERAQEAVKFCERWPTSPHHAQALRWADEDRACADEHREKVRVGSGYAALRAELDKPGDDDPHRLEACDAFLRLFRESKFALAEVRAVTAERDRLVRAIDTRAWEAVDGYAVRNPRSYDEIIGRARGYAQRPDARHGKAAADLIDRTAVAWDRDEYEAVRAAAREAGDKTAIEAAVKAARRYLAAPRPLRRRAESVKGYVAWFEGFQEENEYGFTVKSVHIPRGSDLDHGDNWTRVLVHYGDNLEDTGTGHKGNDAEINYAAGPLRFKWGQRASVNLTVERENKFSFGLGNPTLAFLVDDDPFPLGRLNGTLTAVCKKGKTVEVRVECPAAVPPALPAYPEK